MTRFFGGHPIWDAAGTQCDPSLCCWCRNLEMSQKFGVPFQGVLMIRIIVFWGLSWGSIVLGNYHQQLMEDI